MPCYHPLQAHQGGLTENGKASITFQPTPNSTPLELPCGQCIGCRLERSRQWALRCVHEASLHDQNSFITLTYAPEYLPDHGNLVKSDFQKFMKRFRKEINKNNTGEYKKIRYYMCGEYGDEGGRPHYHACIFGYDFPDKWLWKTENDIKHYRSPQLEELWPWGNSSTGDVTFESAAYVARYVTKKITGAAAKEHYERLDETTGQIINLQREYNDMSRRPGIARDWYNLYKSDLRKDFITSRGVKMKPPKYYDRLLEQESESQYLKLKEERKKSANKALEKEMYEGNRLKVKETIKLKQAKQLVRNLNES